MPHDWNILGLRDYEIKEIEGQNQVILQVRYTGAL